MGNAFKMFKVFVFVCLCLALAYAAPSVLHSTPILTSTSYHTLPSLQVIRPIWTSPSSRNIVRPISYGGGYGWW